MKKSTLTVLAACALAPWQLQAETPQDVIAGMLAPTAAPAPSTAAQRATIAPTLAAIPADCDFISIYNIPTFIQNLAAKSLMSEEDATDSPIIALTHAGNLSLFESFLGVCQCMSDYQGFQNLFSEWAQIANADYAPTLAQTGDNFNDASVLLPTLIQESLNTEACFYTSVQISGQMAPMIALYMAQAPVMAETLPEGFTLTVGDTELTLAITGKALQTMLSGEEPDADEQAALAALEDKTFYVTANLQGNILNITLSSSLDQIQWAASPEASILGTDKAAFLDKQLNDNAFFACYASAETLNALNNVSSNTLRFEIMASIFNALGDVKPENKEAFSAATSAIIEAGTAYLSVLPTYQSPATSLGWMDDDINFECSMPLCAEYIPGNLKMSGLANDPKTLIYAETTDMAFKGIDFSPWAVIPAKAQTIAKAVALTLKPEEAQQVNLGSIVLGAALNGGEGLPAEYAPFYQMAENTLGQICTIAKSAGDSLGLVINEPATPAELPPFVVFAGIEDKSTFSTSCQLLYNTLALFAPAGIPKDVLSVSESGDITSVSTTIEDLTLTAQLSNSLLTIANDAALQANAEQQASPIPTAASVFMLNMKPLSTLCKASSEGDPETIEIFEELEKAIKAFYTTVQTENGDLKMRFKIDLF